jgi:hypothetical protein
MKFGMLKFDKKLKFMKKLKNEIMKEGGDLDD